MIFVPDASRLHEKATALFGWAIAIGHEVFNRTRFSAAALKREWSAKYRYGWPRWDGDTNFMPVLASTRVLSQHLESSFGMLAPLFNALDAQLI
jgi:hypothetical protein